MAMKATYGVFGGKEVPIYKDPKTDEGGLKKSQKGCCRVYQKEDGSYACVDGYEGWIADEDTILRTVFKDGSLFNLRTFQEIRGRMYA
jgi:nicotinamide phosphoribosyltransferase